MAPISLTASVIAAIIYAVRDPLRHYELKRRLNIGGWRPSLILLAVFAVIVGFAIISAAMLLAPVVAEIPHVAKAARVTHSMIPIMPTVSLLFLTIAIMFVGTSTYVRRLQSRFPPPIYCDVNRMCQLVLRSLGDTYLAPRPVKKDLPESETYGSASKQAGAQDADSKDSEATPSDRGDLEAKETGSDEAFILRAPAYLEVLSARRNRTAGLNLTIKEHITLWEREQRAIQYAAKSDAAEYDVSTDEWAQILHFEPRKQKIRLAIYEPDVKTGR